MKGACFVTIVLYTLIITAHGYLNNNYDRCHNVNCGHGKCQVSYGGNPYAYCACHSNYYGSHCTIPDPCHSYHCDHGSCHVHVSNHGRDPHAFCRCDAGFLGHHCETPDFCHNYDCGHGRCIVSNHGGNPHAYCECDSSHYGDHCETRDLCHNYDCGHGKCVVGNNVSNHHAYCVCDSSHYGDHCETLDLCHDLECVHGLCLISNYGGKPHGYCDCDADFYGDRCQTFDLCRNYLCHSGGVCHVHHDDMRPFCRCQRGYFGPHCIYGDPCIMSHPCQHGGTCHFSQHSYVQNPFHIPEYNCSCSPEYTGHDCEILKTTTSTSSPPTTAGTYTATASTSTSPTTTTATGKQYLCNGSMAITDLANNHVSHNAISSSCVKGDDSGSEAFVLNHCNVQNPASWQKGQQVMTLCDSLPIYTPIATFTNGNFVPGNDTTAIFLGCIGGEMRIGLQTCGVGARIEHFSPGGIDFRDANMYYTIQ